MSRHYKPCQFCEREEYCIHCDKIIDCKTRTNCLKCGDIFGRPKSIGTARFQRLLAAGLLLIDLTGAIPMVDIIIDKKGFTDPGGKFDPSQDRDIMMTAMREMKEETGKYVILTDDDPYVEFFTGENGYRCFVAVHKPGNMKCGLTQGAGDVESVQIPLCSLLGSKMSRRLERLMESPMNHSNETLSEFLHTFI